jgi:Flp pilus assembly protein TadG
MAMVEMVFVMPILVLLVFAIAQFGLMFSRWLTLSNAVREGAREGAAYRPPPRAAIATAIENDVKDKVKGYASAGGVDTSTLVINVNGAGLESDGQIEVDASYDFKVNIPFFSVSKIPLKYESTMRIE